MEEKDPQKKFINLYIDRVLAIKALRKIRGTLDEFEREELKNKKVAKYALIFIAVLLLVFYVYMKF
ncbi:MAG: hypothetical protein OQK69_11545 [Gammaproteobacteria bacterium]|nr:hypothetical protein [Gammaproteobacteria bacterium]